MTAMNPNDGGPDDLAAIDRYEARMRLRDAAPDMAEALKFVSQFLAEGSNDPAERGRAIAMIDGALIKAGVLGCSHRRRAARADTRIAELEAALEVAQIERNSLRDFANDVMESWPHGDVDGCDLERMAVDHGLLALKDPKPTEPCGDNCACSGYPSPEEWTEGIDCYVRTPLLKGKISADGNGESGDAGG